MSKEWSLKLHQPCISSSLVGKTVSLFHLLWLFLWLSFQLTVSRIISQTARIFWHMYGIKNTKFNDMITFWQSVKKILVTIFFSSFTFFRKEQMSAKNATLTSKTKWHDWKNGLGSAHRIPEMYFVATEMANGTCQNNDENQNKGGKPDGCWKWTGLQSNNAHN